MAMRELWLIGFRLIFRAAISRSANFISCHGWTGEDTMLRIDLSVTHICQNNESEEFFPTGDLQDEMPGLPTCVRETLEAAVV